MNKKNIISRLIKIAEDVAQENAAQEEAVQEYWFPHNAEDIPIDPRFGNKYNANILPGAIPMLLNFAADPDSPEAKQYPGGFGICLPVNTKAYRDPSDPDYAEAHNYNRQVMTPKTLPIKPGSNTKSLTEQLDELNEGSFYDEEDRKQYERDMNNLERLGVLFNHEGIHGILTKIQGNVDAYSRYADENRPGDWSWYGPSVYKELPSIVAEQMYNAPKGYLRPDSERNAVEHAFPGEPTTVDGYYDWSWPKVDLNSGGEYPARKFYWGPRQNWVNFSGKYEETPYEVDTLKAFNKKQAPLTAFPKPWQNAVNNLNLENILQADQDYDANPKRYKNLQAQIQRGLKPLSDRVPYRMQEFATAHAPHNDVSLLPRTSNTLNMLRNPVNTARLPGTPVQPETAKMTLYPKSLSLSEQKQRGMMPTTGKYGIRNPALLDPIPIGLPELQNKHYITPFFDEHSDVRSMEQMRKIRKDVNDSYNLDKTIRKGFDTNGNRVPYRNV